LGPPLSFKSFSWAQCRKRFKLRQDNFMPFENLLYLHDSYLRSFSAEVVAEDASGVVLSKTAFYPTGGGQPHDTGVLRSTSGSSLRVIDVVKMGDEVLHVLEGGALQRGEQVTGEIDWERRYKFMRLHSAVHLVDGVIMRDYKEAFLTGSNIGEEGARFDLDWPDLRKEQLPELEERVNQEALKGRQIRVKFLSRDEASALPILARTKPGQELLSQLDWVRVVEIVGLDEQMDGGTHVANTKEIGEIRLLGFENKGRHNKRIELRLNPRGKLCSA